MTQGRRRRLNSPPHPQYVGNRSVPRPTSSLVLAIYALTENRVSAIEPAIAAPLGRDTSVLGNDFAPS